MEQLPEIDAGSGALDPSTVTRVGDALASPGFVSVRHSALDPELLGEVERCSRRLFELELPRKRSLTNASIGTQPRGHAIFGAERARAGHPGELKEAWHVGPPAGGEGLEPNLWPDELPELRPVIERYFTALWTVGEWTLRCCERYLGLGDGALVSMIEGGPGLLRVLSYPRLRGGSPRIPLLRTASHTDSCLVTVMGNPSHPGLEIQGPDDEWITAPDHPEQALINGGDILQIVSGGRLRSAPHRVRTRGEPGSERLAVPLFLIPRHECSLSLPPAEDGGPARQVTVGEYLRDRLAELPRQ